MSAQSVQRKKALFLEAYRRLGTVFHAAEAAGIGRRTHYDWMAVDAAYKQAVAEAENDAIEALEAEARRRAFAGSDTLLIFLMKGAMPSKYRERVDITHDIEKAIERITDDPEEREAAVREANRILAEGRA